MFDNIPSYSYYMNMHYISPWFDSLSPLPCRWTGWTSTTGSVWRWSEQRWRGKAGGRGWSGWSERPSRSPEERLRCKPTLYAQEYFTINRSAVIIVCIFLIFLCVSHSASFVKHIVSAILLKIIKRNQEITFLYLLLCVSNIISFSWTVTASCSAWCFWGYSNVEELKMKKM